jgi:hypothetical protein
MKEQTIDLEEETTDYRPGKRTVEIDYRPEKQTEDRRP